jgi:hypothetical protein
MPINIPLIPGNNNKNSKLNEFLSQVRKNGLARQNRYAVVIHRPSLNSGSQVVGNPDSSDMYRLLILFCEAAQLPGMGIGTSQVQTYGEIRENPHSRIFEPITMTFYMDLQMRVKSFFDDWFNFIYDPNTRHLNFYDNYTTQIDIYQEDVKDFDNYVVHLYEAYPRIMNAMELNYGSKDIHRLPITFQYKYWRSEQLLPAATGNQARRSPWDLIVNTALTVQDQLNLGLNGISQKIPSIVNSSGGYFNSFTNFQNNLNQNASRLGIGVSNYLGNLL